jgi:hypothetical protein
MAYAVDYRSEDADKLRRARAKKMKGSEREDLIMSKQYTGTWLSLISMVATVGYLPQRRKVGQCGVEGPDIRQTIVPRMSAQPNIQPFARLTGSFERRYSVPQNMSPRVLSGIAWMKRRPTWLLAPAAAGIFRLGSLETVGADVQPCNATELARGSPPWHDACQSFNRITQSTQHQYHNSIHICAISNLHPTNRCQHDSCHIPRRKSSILQL